VILAEVGSTSYNIMLLFHVLLVIVAFGAPFVNAPLYRFAARDGVGGPVAKAQALATTRVAIPALLVAGLLGFGLSGMSDEAYKLSQGWLSAAVVIWLAQAALYFFGIIPAMRKVGEGDEAAATRVSILTGVLHLSLVVMLWLMIWKPGL
jgi:uncharacterized membrane protein